MKKTLELTPFEFNCIDFSEAKVTKLPIIDDKTLTVECWGMTVLFRSLKHICQNLFDLDSKTDMYLSGECTFSFEKITSYSYSCFDKSGCIINSSCTFGPDLMDSFAVYRIFDISLCHKTLPSSSTKWMNLSVSSLSKVKITFETSDLIDVLEYCKSPNKYSCEIK